MSKEKKDEALRKIFELINLVGGDKPTRFFTSASDNALRLFFDELSTLPSPLKEKAFVQFCVEGRSQSLEEN